MVCAQIDPDALYMDYPKACQVDDSAWPSRDVGYGSPNVGGHRTTVHLPFSGDGETLRTRPSTYHFGPKPNAEFDGDRLDVRREYPDDRPFDIDGTVRNWVSQIERELRVVDADLSGFTESLEQEARTAIAARKELGPWVAVFTPVVRLRRPCAAGRRLSARPFARRGRCRRPPAAPAARSRVH
jgi:hypothetical protein